MKIRTLATLSLLIVPNFLYATTGPLGSLVDLANTLAGGVVTSLGYLMFTLAVVAFFWGIVQFIWAARGGDAGKGVENGKQFMLWGIIALFVMFSVWGIVKFAQGVFNIQGQTSITIPNIQLLGSTPSASSGANGLNGGGASGASGNNGSSASTTDCPNGPMSACTTKDATGATVSGFCDNTSKCVPSRTSGPVSGAPCTMVVCTTTCSNVIGKYNTAGQCVPDGNVLSSSLSFNQPCEPEAVSLNASGQGQNIPLCGAGLSCPYDDIVCKISDGLTCQNDTDCSVFHSKCLAGRSGVKICTKVN